MIRIGTDENGNPFITSSLSDSIVSKVVRKGKGKSILEDVADYVAIDLETTGLDPSWDSIIEIAAIKVRNGEIIDQYQTLIYPGEKISEYITELTGITNEMLESAPTIQEILPQFLGYVGDMILVAHNANFDVNYIYDACIEHLNKTFSNNFVDVCRVSRRLFKEEHRHRLKDLVARLNIPQPVEHRALSDAKAAYLCYEHMKKHARQHGISFESLNQSSKGVFAKDIVTSNTEFNESSLIFGKTFVFSGILQRMVRKEAMQLVVDMGGVCGDNVTKKTNYLVLGNNDYCTTIKDGKSGKQKKAESLQLAGVDIEVISENVFYEMLFTE